MNDVPARAAAIVCTGCVSYAGLDFQPAPVAIGLAAAFLVRVPLYKPKARFFAEASFMLLGMLGTFVTIQEYRLAAGPAFWTGIVVGGAASSLLEIAKAAARTEFKDRLQAAARILLNIKG